jgi:hypothetical protein
MCAWSGSILLQNCLSRAYALVCMLWCVCPGAYALVRMPWCVSPPSIMLFLWQAHNSSRCKLTSAHFLCPVCACCQALAPQEYELLLAIRDIKAEYR